MLLTLLVDLSFLLLLFITFYDFMFSFPLLVFPVTPHSVFLILTLLPQLKSLPDFFYLVFGSSLFLLPCLIIIFKSSAV